MFSEDKVTEIFYLADEFCKFFDAQQEKSMLAAPQDGKKHRRKPNRMSDAEIIVILIHFHSGGFRCFKHYYLHYICKHCKHLFPKTVSYNRFVELEKEVLLQMTSFIKQVFAWRVHRNKFYRQHSASCMPQSAHTHTQDIWRSCKPWQVFLGLVLWIQTAPGHKRQGRNP